MTTSSIQDSGNMSLLSSNYSEEFINSYLKELDLRTINIMIPAIVFLIGIAVLGAVGNSLVLFLYWRKRTSSPNRIFILTLSSFDLLTNVFVVPEDIYDMFDYWTFNRPALCKVRHYLYTCNTIASALALLAICVTRYRKICRPFGIQVTVTHAKIACLVLTVLSLLFSVPSAIMNGVKTVKTYKDGIYGYQCGYQDAYLKTKWPMVNAAFFILLFILVCIPLVVLYILIGVKARHHKSLRISSVASRSYSRTSSSEVMENVSKLTEEVTNESVCAEDAKTDTSVATSSLDTCKCTDVDDEVFTYTRPKQDETTNSNDKYAPNSSYRIQSAPNKKINKGQNSYRMRKKSSIFKRGRSQSQDSTISVRKSNRTTVMLASITMVFILSFLPFLAVLFYKFAAPESFNRLSPEVESLCHLLLRSYLLNTAANPVIYNLCDVNFRRECFKLLKFWYRKICQPFGRQVTVTNAKVACIVLAVLSLLFSVPTAIMNGVKTVKTSKDGIYGFQCGYQDAYLKTKWPMVNAAFFILLFILVCFPLVVLYILIGVKARHHKSLRISSVASKSYSMTSSSEVRENVSKLTEEVTKESVCAQDAKTETSNATSSLDTCKCTDLKDEVFTNTRPKLDETTNSCDKYASNSSYRIHSAPNKQINKRQNSYRMRKKSSILKRGRSESQDSTISVRKSNRTTVMLASITMVFILSFLPFLAVLFYKFAAPDSFNRLSPVAESLCHLLLRSYLLNTAANPVIYNLCDVNFRRECFKLLKFW
ncbi:uncharacterized protein LOC131955201 [Physella acuta]|uniref:uncharacterized protein LOC131955201 n=1 Tax=Physella acuta TaxID=109671 RepID=UPI0027DC3F78|nr:uncharacterized protein LOC131955201 [Physella acuta]